MAVRAAHFLATSAVTADALPFMHPIAMQTNPTSALSNFTWANMGYPKAKPRGLTIAGLTVSVACIATKIASQFAGLDISVKETSICIVDGAGKIVREVKVASEPEALLRC